MNCIRCGRTTADGTMFCAECAPDVSKPLEESEYINKRVVLPDRRAAAGTKAARPALTPPQKKKPSALRKRFRKLVATIVVLSLLCVALLGVCGYGIYNYLGEYQRQRNRLRVQEEELARRDTQITQLQTSLEEAGEELQSVNKDLRSQELEIQRLEQQINIYKVQDSETEFAIRELQEENLSLVEAQENLTKEVKTLTEEKDSLAKELSSLRSQNSSLREKSNFVDDHVAFVENDGTGYYHCYECSRFKGRSYWAFSVNLAISRGYTECPYCH